MRTKHFLAALCVPMAFAACSNEEFVNEIPSLESRGTVNVTLNAEKPSIWAADTRMSIDENYKFVWEKDTDVIGAAMADGSTFQTIINNVLVNYPFVAQNTGLTSNFNGKSSISKGSYLFYYGYTDAVSREGLDLSVPTQTYKVAADGKSALEQAAGYMKMISPIIELGDGVTYEKAQDYNLNLKFTNLYSIVKVDVASKNITAGVTPKLEKVTLNAIDAAGSGVSFVKTAKANLEVIANKANGNSLVVTPGADGKLVTAEMDEALEGINALIDAAVNATASTVYQTTGITYGPAEVNVDGDLALSGAETTSLYILVPRGTYNQGLTLTVETSEGTYTKNITKPTGKDLVLGDNVQVIKADLDFKQDGTGNVILPTTFDIASSEDWAHAVEFVTNHSISYVKKEVIFALTKDIEIPSLPIFEVTISGTNTVTLTEDYAITEQNKDQFTATNAKLGVKAGATLTLATTATEFAEIVNNGTLVVAKDQTKKITNLGVMNVTADATLSGGLVNGQVEDKSAELEEIAGTINVSAEKILKIETVKLDNLVGNVNVNGTLDIAFDSENKEKGIITIAKKANVVGSGGTPGVLTNTGTVSNFGALKIKVTNTDGTIIAQDGGISSATTATISSGLVKVMNVTTFAATQGISADKYDFSAGSAPIVTTEVTNAAQYAKADELASKITNITLAGGNWTLASVAGGDDTQKVAVPANASGLTLKNATLTLEVALADKAIVADGTSTIKAASALDITGAALTVNEGATLNVENNITVNSTATANDLVAEILGTLNVKAGAKMYFNTVTVGSAEKTAAAVNVSGDTEAINTPAEFGVQNTFQNYGMVKSESGNAAAGKVSQPTNMGDAATFKGNAAIITFV